MGIVKVIEEFGRKTVMRDIHRPVKGKSKGWENHSLQTLIRLVKKGDEHGKAERLLLVSLEITAPRYIWQEFDTYTVGVIKGNSESTMYTLLKELEKARYSTDLEYLFCIDTPVYAMDMMFDLYKNLKGIYPKNKLRKIIKASLPEGFLQTRTRIISYQTLRRMYHQRKNHLLPWWDEFFTELLPQLREKELILATWNLKPKHKNQLETNQ